MWGVYGKSLYLLLNTAVNLKLLKKQSLLKKKMSTGASLPARNTLLPQHVGGVEGEGSLAEIVETGSSAMESQLRYLRAWACEFRTSVSSSGKWGSCCHKREVFGSTQQALAAFPSSWAINPQVS